MKKFWRKFLNLEGSLVHYILGTAMLTIVLQFIYDMVDGQWQLWGTGGLSLLLLGLTFYLVWNEYRKEAEAAKMVVQNDKADQRKGLIVLVSPGNTEVPMIAINHHAETLQHCWLVASQESYSTADEIETEVHKLYGQRIKVHDVMEYLVKDANDIKNAWKIVDMIYAKDAGENGLLETDIIADITGGTKPITAGAALACSSESRDMQYITTPRDDDGNPISGAPRIPVLIRSQFIKARE